MKARRVQNLDVFDFLGEKFCRVEARVFTLMAEPLDSGPFAVFLYCNDCGAKTYRSRSPLQNGTSIDCGSETVCSRDTNKSSVLKNTIFQITIRVVFACNISGSVQQAQHFSHESAASCNYSRPTQVA